MSTLPPIDLTPTPLPASSGVSGDTGVVALAQADLLAVFDRFFPEEYLSPMKTGLGDGYEAFQACALAWARVSAAVTNLAQANYLLSAPLGAQAVGTVNFSRPAGPAPAVTINTGTLLKASDSGRLFRTTAPAVFPLGSLGPISAPVQAVSQGYQGNAKGQAALPNNVVIPGEIDTIVLPFQSPPFADTTIVVTQPQDLSGGLPAALEQLAADRGVARQPGETQGHFRARARTLPDTVSPASFRRLLTDITSVSPGSFSLLETFQTSFQTCWDAPGVNSLGGLPWNPALFVYDDPTQEASLTEVFQDRWLDENDHAGGVIVVLPAYVAIQENGIGYDDTATFQSDLKTALGQRATPAYDVPDGVSGVVTPPGCYDGYDLPAVAIYQGVKAALNQIKAGGVSVEVVTQGG